MQMAMMGYQNASQGKMNPSINMNQFQNMMNYLSFNYQNPQNSYIPFNKLPFYSNGPKPAY